MRLATVRENSRSRTVPDVMLSQTKSTRTLFWPDGDTAPACTCCNAKFTVARRKHLCRRCGKMVCSQCSPDRAVVAACGPSPVRVCATCQSTVKDAARGVQFDSVRSFVQCVQAGQHASTQDRIARLRMELDQTNEKLRQLEFGRNQGCDVEVSELMEASAKTTSEEALALQNQLVELRLAHGVLAKVVLLQTTQGPSSAALGYQTPPNGILDPSHHRYLVVTGGNRPILALSGLLSPPAQPQAPNRPSQPQDPPSLVKPPPSPANTPPPPPRPPPPKPPPQRPPTAASSGPLEFSWVRTIDQLRSIKTCKVQASASPADAPQYIDGLMLTWNAAPSFDVSAHPEARPTAPRAPGGGAKAALSNSPPIKPAPSNSPPTKRRSIKSALSKSSPPSEAPPAQCFVLVDALATEEVLSTLETHRRYYFERVKQQKQVHQRLQRLQREVVEWENAGHCRKLELLWRLFRPEVPFPGMKDQGWGELGFQGRDPTTDFRGAGLLSLEVLLYMGERHPDLVTMLVRKQRERGDGHSYPLACAVINLVAMLADLLWISNGREKESASGLAANPLFALFCRAPPPRPPRHAPHPPPQPRHASAPPPRPHPAIAAATANSPPAAGGLGSGSQAVRGVNRSRAQEDVPPAPAQARAGPRAPPRPPLRPAPTRRELESAPPPPGQGSCSCSAVQIFAGDTSPPLNVDEHYFEETVSKVMELLERLWAAGGCTYFQYGQMQAKIKTHLLDVMALQPADFSQFVKLLMQAPVEEDDNDEAT